MASTRAVVKTVFRLWVAVWRSGSVVHRTSEVTQYAGPGYAYKLSCSECTVSLYCISLLFLGPFHRAIAVPSVTRCRCCCCRRRCRGHRCAGGVRQCWRATVAAPGEWRVRRLAVTNGPNIFQMLLVFSLSSCIVLLLPFTVNKDEYIWYWDR